MTGSAESPAPCPANYAIGWAAFAAWCAARALPPLPVDQAAAAWLNARAREGRARSS
ncbi:hypothetical protein HLH34_18815, partial [Gluconacetobacter azotocaptans]|nr:hypothetical protein [Gluconacetobacter azotocaptans]